MESAGIRRQIRDLVLSLAVAGASVTLATLLTFSVRDFVAHSRSLMLLVAVMFCAWLRGASSGVAAAIMAIVVFDYFFDRTPGELDFSPGGIFRAVIFLTCSLFVTFLTTQRNRALQKALHANVRLERALKEIRTLRGLLPICMYCKQIRTDTGAWQLIEKYLSDHSEARFTHGICPSCMAEHHPDVVIERKT